MSKTKSIDDYAADIRTLHTTIQDYPESHTLRNRLSARLGKWQAMLDITVLAASNEQRGWTTEELGLPVKAMYTKAVCGYDQVADYQFFISGDIDQWGCLLIERKELSDIYSTLMSRDSRDRFYREISRYEADKRFSHMIIMVEGTFQDFLEYSPKFNGKSFNRNHIGANVASRRATIAGLYARDVPVLWCGNRAQAVKLYPQLVRQACIKNYKKILDIEV